jgi:hypothetical protein
MTRRTLWQWYYQLKSDPRKLTVVIGLAAVSLLVWGRLLVKQVPQSASAESTRQAAPSIPEVGGLSEAGPPDADSDAAVQVSVPARLPRNLFDVRPLLPEKEKLPEPAKSPDESADAPNKPVDLGRLRLQSVMQGRGDRAMINGRIVTVGDTIQGFTLKRVAERSVILEKHDRRYRLGL